MATESKKNEAEIAQSEVFCPVYEADFETAIKSTGFGKFNFLLYLVGLPAALTSQFEITSFSYLLTAAHCDLNLSLENKGMLNAISYLGIITSSLFGGFIADKFGRQKICSVMYIVAGCNVIVSAFAQSYIVLLTLKFLGGIFVGVTAPVLLPYLSEFHDTKKRSRISLADGLFRAVGNILLPVVAWCIFPLNIDVRLFNDYIILHPWNFYLMACSVPGILAGILFIFLPESPKFLMTAGENEKALKVFRRVYSLNTNLPEDTYPVKSLINETKNNPPAKSHGWKQAGKQILSIFLPPYTFNLILVFVIHFSIMCSMNTLRLWLPQLYAAVSEYQVDNPNSSASLCEMLQYIRVSSTPRPNGTDTETECTVTLYGDIFYIRNLISSVAATIALITAMIVVNKTGKKPLFLVCGTVGGITAMCLYFATDITMTVTLSSVSQAFTRVATLITMGVVIDLFPTYLRSMTVALCSAVGRIGAMSGNMIFPFLLLQGCFAPFFFIGAIAVASAILVLLLPKTDNKPLE